MFLIDPVHGSSQHQIIFIAYFLTILSLECALLEARRIKSSREPSLGPGSDAELFMSRT